MKVYVVTAGYADEGNNVMGVYTSLKLARECVDEMKESPEFNYDDCAIEEHLTDETPAVSLSVIMGGF